MVCRRNVTGFVGKMLRIAKEEYINWFCSTKMLLLVFLFVYAKEQLTDSLLELVALTDKPLQWFEPGIAFLGSRPMMLVLPLIYLVLMGNFPKNDGNSLFFITRTGKGAWFMGQVLFSFFSAVTILCGCLFAVTIPCIGKIQWNNGNWSDAVTKYYQAEGAGDFKFELITSREYNHMQPTEVFLHSVCLVLLSLMLLSAIQMLFAVYGKRVAGLAVCSGISVIGNSLSIFEVGGLMWWFPVANTQIWLRHEEILKEEIVPLWQSYVYFVVGVILFLFVAWKSFRGVKGVVGHG